ncbi:hypothetical protein QTP86_023071 [Hemibagrus guttatus]|nr:hypothetical protein QTP86_023071 [Hemibagrus guttatus]
MSLYVHYLPTPLALLPGVVLAGDWVVHVPVSPILAPRGSSVTLPCTYDFPNASGSWHVQSEMWCLNESQCITPDYVYHSAGIFPKPAYQGRVQYLGSFGSKNCSLRINNLRMTDSSVYVFRFITNHPVNKLPRQRGVTLQVTGVATANHLSPPIPIFCILNTCTH